MKKVIAVAGLLLMLGCSPHSTSTAAGPGNEATSETSPSQEDTTPPTDGGDGGDAEGEDNQAVSVELPGLPIGGSGAVFSLEAPTQCVDVSVTGFAVPEGVGIKFTEINVPEQFTRDSSPCSGPPCVGSDFRITAETGGCTVSVTWKGDPADAGQSYALSADTEAFCTSRAACADVEAAVDAAKKTQSSGEFTIGLIVLGPAEGESTATDGGSTPTDGASTPTDGASEEPSPSDGSTGG